MKNCICMSAIGIIRPRNYFSMFGASLQFFKIRSQQKMKKLLLLFLSIFTQIGTVELNPNYCYADFCDQFDCNYQGEEKAQHHRIFNLNYQKLIEGARNGMDVQVNEFLDWNESQLQIFFNYHPEDMQESEEELVVSVSASTPTYPDQFDWRDYLKVTPVRHQKSCGSCWAFSSTAQYQSLLLLYNNQEYDLAEQYIVQCDQGSSGCKGGYPLRALQLMNKTGIPLQDEFPYQSNDTYFSNICNSDDQNVKLRNAVSKIKHYKNLTDEQIQQKLIDHGPFSVGVSAMHFGFTSAGTSGIVNCSTSQNIDHSVLLFGYTKQYWIVKNSWGSNWGKNGIGYIPKQDNCRMSNYVDVMEVEGQKYGVTKNFSIEMTDSYGDGWNGNIFGIKRGSNIIATFGEYFNSGFTHEDIVLSLEEDSLFQVIVIQLGSFTSEIGFKIKDETGTVLIDWNQKQVRANNVFGHICYKCDKPLQSGYSVSLRDRFGDGWNGNVLFLQQDGRQKQMFGSNFEDGHQFETFKIQVLLNEEVHIGVQKLREKSDQIQFEIRNSCNQIIFHYQGQPGQQMAAGSMLGSFCPACFNLRSVRILEGRQQKRLNQQQEAEEGQQQEEASQNPPQQNEDPVEDDENQQSIVPEQDEKSQDIDEETSQRNTETDSQIQNENNPQNNEDSSSQTNPTANDTDSQQTNPNKSRKVSINKKQAPLYTESEVQRLYIVIGCLSAILLIVIILLTIISFKYLSKHKKTIKRPSPEGDCTGMNSNYPDCPESAVHAQKTPTQKMSDDLMSESSSQKSHVR